MTTPHAAPSLTELANATVSDKGTAHPYAHHYTLMYELLLGPRRSSLRRMLEIGLRAGGPEVGGDVDRVADGAPSVDMWLQYFPQAEICGFDISDFSFVKHPRFRFARGDSGVAADLERAAAMGPFDFIVDDGSHASFHQQLALTTLFPALEPGGLFIIEDLHWQSPFYEDQLPRTWRTADLIDSWFRTRRFPPIEASELAGLEDLADQIAFAFVVEEPFAHDLRRPKMAVIQKAG